MAIEISIQHTPNPNSVKINTNQTLFEGARSTSLKAGDETEHPLALALLAIAGIDNIFGIRDFVTVSKTADAEWDTILPQVKEVFQAVYA
ncbi:NifU N-terminal domain-containing protein [Paenibacillus agricola]|uniref:Scaffolding protein n=1 Tax=Paenibacillus agricola TaxID=2716264 RepID=A0ABX0J1T8_9BACL|nr:NifU N-terminal domain-containing protein [Paenibacillus agricola]NHN30292.1 scaffolding protein [Paenibacillus agricola]